MNATRFWKLVRWLGTPGLILVLAGSAFSQGIPGVEPNKCLAGKTTCVSRLAAGLLKCRELCQRRPDRKCGSVQAECEAKALARFDGGANPEKGCFEKLEARQVGSRPTSLCTTEDDAQLLQSDVDGVVQELLATLEGAPAPTCGDGSINVAGEQCDGVDLGGTTCGSLNAGVGSLACTESCRFDARGCVALPDPCVTAPCDANAACTRDSPSNSDFTCTCNPGFVGDGLTCIVPDPCLTAPCDINATCARESPLNSDFTCTCNPGFVGDGLTCIVPDPCLNAPCDINATCTRQSPLNSEFTCTCNPGFVGDGLTCTDVCLTDPFGPFCF